MSHKGIVCWNETASMWWNLDWNYRGVIWLIRWVEYLQSDVISKSDGRQRDEAVVKAVEIIPTLVSWEDSGAGRYNDARQEPRGHHQVHLCGFGFFAFQISFDLPYHHRGSLIQTLSYALEHDQPQGNSHHRVEHAKRLTSYGYGGRVAVTWYKIKKINAIQ